MSGRPPSTTSAGKQLAENSHQPVRRREREKQRFDSPGSAQRFLAIYATVQDAFYVQRHLLPRRIFKMVRVETFAV
jgi:putative transposase